VHVIEWMKQGSAKPRAGEGDGFATYWKPRPISKGVMNDTSIWQLLRPRCRCGGWVRGL
jgi:hypothetical protein